MQHIILYMLGRMPRVLDRQIDLSQATITILSADLNFAFICLWSLLKFWVVKARNNSQVPLATLGRPQAIYKLVYGFALCRIRIWALRFRFGNLRKGRKH